MYQQLYFNVTVGERATSPTSVSVKVLFDTTLINSTYTFWKNQIRKIEGRNKMSDSKTTGICACSCGGDPKKILFAACKGYPYMHESLLAPAFANSNPDQCVIHLFAMVMAWRLEKIEAEVYRKYFDIDPLVQD